MDYARLNYLLYYYNYIYNNKYNLFYYIIHVSNLLWLYILYVSNFKTIIVTIFNLKLKKTKIKLMIFYKNQYLIKTLYKLSKNLYFLTKWKWISLNKIILH